MDIAGFGTNALCLIPVNGRFEMDIEILTRAIETDRDSGLFPFLVVGTAGTVDVGVVDDLAGIVDIAKRNGLWFHVDGALGALARLMTDVAPRVKGIEKADSIAFDFHKWGQVPYDAGFILVKDGTLHRDTFSTPDAYLLRGEAMANGSDWPCDFGPDLSRSFRALKTWFTIKVYGADKLVQVISHTCELAQYLRKLYRGKAGTGAASAGGPEHRLLPLPLRLSRPSKWEAGRTTANLGDLRAFNDDNKRLPGNSGGHCQPPYDPRRYRRSGKCHMCSGSNLRGRKEQCGSVNFATELEIPETIYEHPDGSLIGLGPLMTMAYNRIDLTPLGLDLLHRANQDGGGASANALMDVAVILQIKDSPDVALALQQQALEYMQVYRLPAKRQPAIRLLALKSPGPLSANTPLEFLVEDSDIDLTMLYVAPGLPLPDSLPEHDVMIVAIGQSGQGRATLKWLEKLVPVWPRPVLNLPDRIARLSRDVASCLLHSVPGVVIPKTIRVARASLERIACGESILSSILDKLEFPIIIRPVVAHAGIGLVKANDVSAISDYLGMTPGDHFYVARFVDYRSEDGLYRKYRVVLIDGRPYAGHMAISTHWMVHYLNGGMDLSAAKRCEEERFISAFDQEFAPRHQEALQCTAKRMGLDYLVMDCAETQDGKLFIFEVDSSAVVHAMDPVDLFPYKKPQLRKVAAAFRAMLAKAAL
jgi:glutathione synthase/RimK-type ligase-like ATP-grasp enzyme